MSIDTAEKRKSISGVPFLPLSPGVTPNASMDAEWRQQAGWSYSGIIVIATEPPIISDGSYPGHLNIEIAIKLP